MIKDPISFHHIGTLCRAEGCTAAAVMHVPEKLESSGLDRMLADGVGDMEYMRRHRDLLLNPKKLFPKSNSLVIATLAYQSRLIEGKIDESRLQRARYAAGSDYHKIFRRKLSSVGKNLIDGEGNSFPYRACVDSAPLQERRLAQMAGLGWIGKNALLILPDSGSYQFLGFLFTKASLEITREDHAVDRCGSCRACHDACPTDALVERRVLSERCISYLTIEHSGLIPRKLAEKFNGWWFGCDICQEVCPWNRFAQEPGDTRLEGHDLEHRLLEITAASFDIYFAGRAVRRIGYERFRRNLLVALWSIGRIDECLEIVTEGLPLVQKQAKELQIK